MLLLQGSDEEVRQRLPAEIEELFASIDTSGHGRIGLEEFKHFYQLIITSGGTVKGGGGKV